MIVRQIAFPVSCHHGVVHWPDIDNFVAVSRASSILSTEQSIKTQQRTPTMASDGGLGSALVGEKIVIGQRSLHVSRLLGEGKYH